MKQRREEKRREDNRREEKRRRGREEKMNIEFVKEVVIALAFMTGREQVRTLQRGEQWRRRSVGLDCSML